MRIAINAAAYEPGRVGGFQRYTGELLGPLLESEPDAVVLSASARLQAELAGRVRPLRPRALAAERFTGNLLRLFWHQGPLPRLLRRTGMDVYYSPVPEGMLAPPCPQVLTVHDLIPLRYPESSPRVARYYRHVLPRILRRATAIVVVSRATEADLRERFQLRDIPIHVVYQGFRAEVFHPGGGVEADSPPFLLAVGETRGYKNLRGLLAAFARLPRSDLRLVVVGPISPYGREVVRLPAELGVAERVRFLGKVSDDRLAALYRGARAFVFPSLWEGFGIPALEAMACGCPVVASSEAAIPEVCGDAALYVDARDPDSIAEGIATVVGDDALRDEMRLRGLERARRFSYARAAREILDVLREAAASRRASELEPVAAL